MKTIANEQAFLTLYLKPNPESWKDKIVFIEPLFDTLPPAQMLFNTLRLENRAGLVVSGPKMSLVKFKEHLYEADNRNGIGKASDENILKFIMEEAKDKGLSVDFVQKANLKNKELLLASWGFTKLGDVYANKERTKLIAVVEGKLYGIGTYEFKKVEINSHNEIPVNPDISFDISHPNFMPQGLNKDESMKWNSYRITKPLAILDTIEKIAKATIAKAKE